MPWTPRDNENKASVARIGWPIVIHIGSLLFCEINMTICLRSQRRSRRAERVAGNEIRMNNNNNNNEKCMLRVSRVFSCILFDPARTIPYVCVALAIHRLRLLHLFRFQLNAFLFDWISLGLDIEPQFDMTQSMQYAVCVSIVLRCYFGAKPSLSQKRVKSVSQYICFCFCLSALARNYIVSHSRGLTHGNRRMDSVCKRVSESKRIRWENNTAQKRTKRSYFCLVLPRIR